MGASEAFRFRPRFRAFAWVCIGLGVGVAGWALVAGLTGPSRTFALACGVVGPLLGVLYLAAPAWRFRVVVDDDALSVQHGDELRFRVPWSEVKRCVHAPSSKTLHLDGGGAARSFLLPGPGAPGPYRIDERERLYDLIVARVPADRLEEVASLETARRDNPEPRGT